jgi:alkanesulfonate monooxygenase SsuD/methylene tetrahydromethanopterin reductase-like flavin-dependent oxidoreductase (luciferase family)
VAIKIGVFLPVSTPDPSRPILGDVRASARFAEEAGLDSVWTTDHLIASAPMLDATVVLATAAAGPTNPCGFFPRWSRASPPCSRTGSR